MGNIEKRANQGGVIGAGVGTATGLAAAKHYSPVLGKKAYLGAPRSGLRMGATGAIIGAAVGVAQNRRSSHQGISKKK